MPAMQLDDIQDFSCRTVRHGNTTTSSIPDAKFDIGTDIGTDIKSLVKTVMTKSNCQVWDMQLKTMLPGR